MSATGPNCSDYGSLLALLPTMFQKADLEDSDRFLDICRFMAKGLTEMESASFPSVDRQPVIECMATDPFVQRQIYNVLEMILI